MALDIIVDNSDKVKDVEQDEGKALIAWVNGTIQPWIDYRDTNYKDKWDEYYRLWRGIWQNTDKSRSSERSKLISPALQQAIEASVAELEEATFGKGRWYDVTDDIADENPEDIKPYRDLMQQELDDNGARAAISEIYLNGALYGTGIGKIIIEEVSKKTIIAKAVQEGVAVYEPSMEKKDIVNIILEPISPYSFAIDPMARTIDESLGCAHIVSTSKHLVEAKMEEGIYTKCDVGSYENQDLEDYAAKGETRDGSTNHKVKIVEYHGLVPRDLIKPEVAEDEELVTFFEDEGDKVKYDSTDLVEAIVTIANDAVLLRATVNPVMMEDRAFISYQHDTVPNRFWGRGVAEKGYNPQKALDAELRARIDALALTVHPMMAVDGTRMPRGGNLSVQPGRTIVTQGDPNTILRPFNFGQVNATTFHQTGELERMIQMGTGSMDSATPVSVSPRNSTASGMSMILSGAIKRSKRTLSNIERTFIVPFVQKAAWRYMQFDPERFPITDVKFQVTSTLGMMARELEQQQLTNLLQTTQPGSPAYWMILKSIYENSSISDREAMVELADQQLKASLQPAQPSVAEQLKSAEIQATMQNNQARAQADMLRAKADMTRAMVELEKLDSTKAKIVAEALLAQAKAESTVAGAETDQIKVLLDAVIAESRGASNGEIIGATGQGSGDVFGVPEDEGLEYAGGGAEELSGASGEISGMGM